MKNKVISLTISELGAGGDGIGQFEGKPVYVPKTVSGDVIEAQIESESTDRYNGKLLSIKTPSSQRITPPCPHFNQCGGCELQHISENDYRLWKIAKVKTTLERNNIIPEIWKEPVFLPAASRRRTTLAAIRTANDLHLGYHEPRSHNIVSLTKCLILDPALDQTIQKLRPYLIKLMPQRKTLDITLQMAGGLDVVLTGEWGSFNLAQNEILAQMTNDLDIARLSLRKKEFGETEILLARKPIVKTFGALSVNLPPAAFLQASDAGEKALTDIVTRHAKDSQNIADLFCGCGTFAGHLLQPGARVHAVDGDAAAMSVLSVSKHPKLTTQKRNLFKEPLSLKELEKFDCVVFDPPRAGAKEQVTILAQASIPKLIAVSCNPATFARDAKILKEEGYKLKSLTLVDQFVWSSHVEVVGLFTL